MTEETRDGAEPARRRWNPVVIVGGLLVLLQTGVRIPIVAHSFYWQDDFVHLDLARRLGLSQEFVVRNHNGHLEMGANVVYWLLSRYTSLSFLPAALCLLVLQFLASCLLLTVLVQLFGRSPWLLVPFAGYLFTPLALPVATWWAAGLEALPLQIAMMTAVLGAVRAVRTGGVRSWGWAALSAAGTALGLFFYEKAVLVLPAVVAVLVLVEWGGQPLGRRLRLLLRAARYLLPQVLLILGYVPLYLSVATSTSANADRGDAPDVGVLTALGRTVFQMLLPGVFGGPWTDEGAEATLAAAPGTGSAIVFAVLAFTVVATSVWLRGPRALQGWVLLVAYLAVDLTLVQLARADYLYLVARDPRYVTDALPIIAIGVCAAFNAPSAARRRVGRPARRPLWSPVAALVAGVLLVVSGVVTGSLITDGLQHRQAREFLLAVLASMDDAPDVTVVSTRPPVYVSVFATPDLDDVYRAIGQRRPFDRPGTDLRMYLESGALQPIVLLDPLLRSSGPIPGCGWSVAAADETLGALTGPSEGPEVLQVRYTTDQPVTLHLTVGGRELELALAPGTGLAGFVVTGERGPVTARVSGAAPVCVDDVVVGTPWPEGLS